MTLKSLFLQYANQYAAAREEAFGILHMIEPETDNPSELDAIARILESQEFYVRQDLPVIVRLGTKYSVDTDHLQESWKQFQKTGDELQSQIKRLESLGLEEITFGYYGLDALHQGQHIHISFPEFDISVQDEENEEIESDEAEELKQKITNILIAN
jgi:hypothetical protein